MSKTIYKYQLTKGASQLVKMPLYAEIISVGVQDNIPCLWAFVDPESELFMHRHILVQYTGFPVNAGCTFSRFIGTVLVDNGAFVMHIFDYGERPLPPEYKHND